MGQLDTERFSRFSTWKSLVRAISRLKRLARNQGDSTAAQLVRSENFILRQVQMEHYREEMGCISSGQLIPKNSSLLSLNPYMDDEGVLRIGGRLGKGNLPMEYKNPVIIPKQHHVATLLVRHYHDSVQHQGRHITEGAIRAAGLWIVGGKRLICSIIHRCVTCRKLRGKVDEQKMADLPSDRLEPGPPFTYVGVDTFGPWSVVARKTRGGQANQKRWAILFTCLVCRAVHIEVVEDMTTSAFINALRRFIAIRGNVKQFRSDRGTNFVGCTDNLNIKAVNVEDSEMKGFLDDNRTEWVFNPPQASHMGGAWERMIGVCRRILDSVLLSVTEKHLTHEMLTTFMAEVSAIVNARPLVPVSTDPESPSVLSPAMLLTQKINQVSESSVVDQNIDIKDLYRSQWRRVQCLADSFWNRWRKEYLHHLQLRRKWTSVNRNICVGDIVLLKDKTLHRNDWPMAIVSVTFDSDDGLVRKVIVRTFKDGHSREYTRPISDLIVLLPTE